MCVGLVFLCVLFCFVSRVCDFVFFIFVCFCVDSSTPNEDIVRFRCGGGKLYTLLLCIFL